MCKCARSGLLVKVQHVPPPQRELLIRLGCEMWKWRETLATSSGSLRKANSMHARLRMGHSPEKPAWSTWRVNELINQLISPGAHFVPFCMYVVPSVTLMNSLKQNPHADPCSTLPQAVGKWFFTAWISAQRFRKDRRRASPGANSLLDKECRASSRNAQSV